MDIKKFVKLNEGGEIEVDNDAFESMFTAEVNRAVEKYRNGKGKDEIRKQLEEEAKLTAEQKLQAEKEEFEKYKLAELVKLNQDKARAKLDDKLFSKEEIEIYLSEVNDDWEKSGVKLDTLVNARKKFIEDTQKNAIQNLQQQQQNSGAGGNLPKPDNGDVTVETTRTSAEILSYYRK